MKLREIVEALIDADVECGADTVTMIQVDGMPPLSVLSVEIEEGESTDGIRVTGPTIWIKAEEI